jgi:hypothetical protein
MQQPAARVTEILPSRVTVSDVGSTKVGDRTPRKLNGSAEVDWRDLGQGIEALQRIPTLQGGCKIRHSHIRIVPRPSHLHSAFLIT